METILACRLNVVVFGIRVEHTVKAMQKEMKADSQTAFIGTSCLFTLCHKEDNGIAPSLENAYAILNSRRENRQG